MWQVIQRMVLTPVLSVVRKASTYEKPPPELGDRIYRHLKKNCEVLPIIGIMAFSTSWACFHVYHAIVSKGDLRANKCKRKKAPHEEIGPTRKTKMYTLHPQNYIPIAELEAIKNDLANEEVPKRPC